MKKIIKETKISVYKENGQFRVSIDNYDTGLNDKEGIPQVAQELGKEVLFQVAGIFNLYIMNISLWFKNMIIHFVMVAFPHFDWEVYPDIHTTDYRPPEVHNRRRLLS